MRLGDLSHPDKSYSNISLKMEITNGRLGLVKKRRVMSKTMESNGAFADLSQQDK